MQQADRDSVLSQLKLKIRSDLQAFCLTQIGKCSKHNATKSDTHQRRGVFISKPVLFLVNISLRRLAHSRYTTVNLVGKLS